MSVSNSEVDLLPQDGHDLAPLPQEYHRGLVAIAIPSTLSFITSSVLFVYLTYKLVSWSITQRAQAKIIARNIPDPVADGQGAESMPNGLPPRSKRHNHKSMLRQLRERQMRPPNQFLILLYNLLLADMHQGTAFMLSSHWLRKNGIFINTTACFTQAFFDSNGDLASSLFITAIAMHTYLSVVRNYRPPQRVLYACIVVIWVFVYCMSTIPLLATNRGQAHGGYFVRAGAWCWINSHYETLRLTTHYIFIFISLVTTTALYIAISLSLRQQTLQDNSSFADSGSHRPKTSHKPIFLIYPIIYVSCTLPLAVGRVASMARAPVPVEYFIFAGFMISCNGLFDCLLFGLTRQSIVFASKDQVGLEDTGINTFHLLRTPAGRQFGNSVWVQGGTGHGAGTGDAAVGGWWSYLSGGKSDAKRNGLGRRARSWSQQSLHSVTELGGIQKDVVAEVTVQMENDPDTLKLASARSSSASSEHFSKSSLDLHKADAADVESAYRQT